MKLARSLNAARAEVGSARDRGSSIGLVPTLGALHEGHVSLMRRARAVCDVVVVSIFVNPLQFGPHEDLEAYPRDEQRDASIAKGAGADLLFTPPPEEMKMDGLSMKISAGPPAHLLEGALRPGHFSGVCTVVAKLFNILQPQLAFFGQKDAQQNAVLTGMVADLDFPVDLIVCPTVRENDGLALSSRNLFLTEAERASAAVLFRALDAGRDVLSRSGGIERCEAAMAQALTLEPKVTVDYARAVDPLTFETPSERADILLVVAARVGRTRLIDNMLVEARSTEERGS